MGEKTKWDNALYKLVEKSEVPGHLKLLLLNSPGSSAEAESTESKPQTDLLGSKPTQAEPQAEQGVNSLVAFSSSRNKKNKAERDPRHRPVAEAYVIEFQRRNPRIHAPFDGSDAKQLQVLLRQQPEASAEQVIDWLRNAFDSDDVPPLRPGFRLREFCAHYSKYLSGPLRRTPGTGPRSSAGRRAMEIANEPGKFDGIASVA